MAQSPFQVLEMQLAKADDAVAKSWIEAGKKLIADDLQTQQKSVWQTYAHQQCKKADEALQGNYSVDHLVLMDRLGLETLQDLWNYRQRMAAISGYAPTKQPIFISTITAGEFENQKLFRAMKEMAPKEAEIIGMQVTPDPNIPTPLDQCVALEFGYPFKTEPTVVQQIKSVVIENSKQADPIIRRVKNTALSLNRDFFDFLVENYSDL